MEDASDLEPWADLFRRADHLIRNYARGGEAGIKKAGIEEYIEGGVVGGGGGRAGGVGFGPPAVVEALIEDSCRLTP